MFLPVAASMKRQAFFRLLSVSCVAIVVVAAAAFWLNNAAFQKAKSTVRINATNHFKERLERQNQIWEEEVLRTKTLVELTKYLEDRVLRWEKLQAYFIAQGSTRQYSFVAVSDSNGKVLFRFGDGPETIPFVSTPQVEWSQEYLQFKERIYRVFRLPVFMGPDGMGYLLLLKPLDNAFLGEISYPDTDLYLTWNGQATASSQGYEGMAQFSKITGKRVIDDSYYEEILLPFTGANLRKPETPVLVIRRLVNRPFSAVETVLLSVVVLAVLAMAIWLSLGSWITRTIRRLLSLSAATEQFARVRKVDPLFAASLAGDSSRQDEMEAFANMTLTMMQTIEAGDEERLRNEDKLKRSNEELEQFAYVASHDLQEPLRKITSFSELLSLQYKGRLDADADRYLEYITDGAYRMQTQIRELLEYSRIDRQGKEFTLTDCDEVLNTTLKYIHLAIVETGAAVTHDPLPKVNADGGQLGQVFQNLITNAIKFRGAETPQIHISAAKQREQEWIFSVKDNGIGIAPEYHDRIFVMFQRLHTRTEYPGTGLGLAICKKIVERHNGRIWVESEQGKGATFRFTIPG